MRNSTARNIRDFITDVPTVPKKMAQVERQLYRAMKRVYNKIPSNQKESFFRSLGFTMAKMRADMRKAAAFSSRITDPTEVVSTEPSTK